jgi:tryptophanyl-tRNA synthetase
VALDWLATGLNPESGSFVIESMVPEHAELMTWVAWFLPVGMLEPNPMLKAEMEAIENPEDAQTKGKSVSTSAGRIASSFRVPSGSAMTTPSVTVRREPLV